jgi:hypothetical protein
MSRTLQSLAAIVIMALLTVLTAAAQEPLTVATFEFQAQDRALQEQCKLARELIDAQMAAKGDVQTVSRVEIDKILTEQQMSLAGLTEQSAPQIGHLLGAQVLIVGRVFATGEDLTLTGRIISTETSRTFAEVVKGNPGDLNKLAAELADKLHGKIVKERAALLAPLKLNGERLKELRVKLAGKRLPKVFIHIKEETAGAPAIDPAAQTEVQSILLKCGCEVVKDTHGVLKTWAEDYMREGGKTAPPKIDGIDLILIGEGISQLAVRNGNLVTCRARVELEALDCADGKLLASDRETQPGTDLAEQIAVKTALQESAGTLACRLLPEAIEKWRGPAASPTPAPPAAK